ncbi:MAG: DUF4239 domain-containing protein [Bradyrhizobium sp.]|uniref:bestrophin-like domain n=1 Tax=Bradyrhizobium sp. TaxID=376 RepID=UPI001D6752B7|nr:DUF4239 domain-containing protein [Bradyrhizobium sp.]MBV9561634.1 DUF4239 domain-containing protein [Bradyrhizobium sp.]
MLFLTTHSLWLSGTLMVGITTLVAMAGPVIVRRYVSLDRLSTNNEVAGFKFATLGVLYAVLLAFAVIVVWERFNDAEKYVAQEAGAAATVYRLSRGMENEPGMALRTAMTDYLRAAISKDWPAMEEGRASLDVNHALDHVYSTILTFRPGDGRETALLAEILHQLDLVTQARRARLVVASGVVPGLVWLVLFSGAVLTIGFTFFFGTENLRAQTIMTGALSILIFSALLTVVAIDHPYSGTVKVGPDALSALLEDFSGTS